MLPSLSMRASTLLPLLLLASGCGDSPEDPAAGATGPHGVPLTETEQQTVDKAHGGSETLYAGEVRLSGALAAATEGVIWMYARKPGTRSPLLIKRYYLDDAAFRTDGAERVLAFDVTTNDSMMPGMPVALPEEVELKIEFDPDGMVETKQGNEAVVLPVEEGMLELAVTLRPGMPKPVEVPSQFPTVVGEDK